ncbi:hypothetical protein [Methylobacterium sp. GC_Met_2]|uniref:hypothetical protein n=1 Tax=Methylobacterium sp. GC_Met_2 TaxID=2937376 RepID=UPI00226B8E8A|nr:hypothetical protein [Methylobacterium sp. GC_Met_2]
MFDDAAARRYLAGLPPVAMGSVRWLIYDDARQWVSVVDGEIASLRKDCEHVLSAASDKEVSASYVDAIREFLVEGEECAPQIVALSCALLTERIGDLHQIFVEIQSGVMVTLVGSDDVIVRRIAG